MELDKPACYETIWISDIHLGYKNCKADYLLDFLSHNTAKTIFLVGDIADFWALKKQLFWPAKHLEVLQKLLKLSEQGTRVIYIPGNHDGVARRFLDVDLGKIEIYPNYIYETRSGARMYITHGDEFDGAVRIRRLVKLVGDPLYEMVMTADRWLNHLRNRFGFKYWSLARYARNRVQSARQIIDLYRNAAIREARRHGFDGIICGHIHHAEMVEQQGVKYCNDGDWVDSCTALIETAAGELKLIHWLDVINSRCPFTVVAKPPRQAA